MKGNGGLGQQLENEPEALLAEAISEELEDSSPSGGSKKRMSQADILIEAAIDAGIQLFHTPRHESFAVLPVKEHLENWPVRSKVVRLWLTFLFLEATNKAPNREALQSALNALDAEAAMKGPEQLVHLRTAWHEGSLYYDLADATWRSVKIGSDGWCVVEQAPVSFRRYAQTAAQVEPSEGGTLATLWDFLNVPEERDRRLLEAWIVTGLIPDIPRPILAFHGDQGSAKSTMCKILAQIIDPSEVPLLKAKDEGELIQGLHHRFAAILDNVSHIPDWMSDLLCRAVTGEGFTKRQLYTDEDDILFAFRRLLMLNGIGVAISRADLLDRTLIIGIDRISNDKRKNERDLWADFAQVRPIILGAVFDRLSIAIAHYSQVSVSDLPRMADFATWSMAASGDPEQFLADFAVNIDRQNEEAIAESSVATVLMSFLDAQGCGWSGLPNELHTVLKVKAEEMKIPAREFPKNPAWLTKRLKEVRPNLLALGWKIEFPRTHGIRRVMITRTNPDNTVPLDSTVPIVTQSHNGAVTVEASGDGKSDKNDTFQDLQGDFDGSAFEYAGKPPCEICTAEMIKSGNRWNCPNGCVPWEEVMESE